MSDIGLIFHPIDLVMIGLILGAPGLPLGAIAGALAWRRHRIWGAALGALAGFGLWLLGWFYFSDNL
jgi:Na+/proline symporter